MRNYERLYSPMHGSIQIIHTQDQYDTIKRTQHKQTGKTERMSWNEQDSTYVAHLLLENCHID